jgi:small GTP-binding protein
MENANIATKAVKVALLGDTEVGKTAICHSFLGVEFILGGTTTVGVDRLDKKIKLKNSKEIKLIVWDTAGQERFRSAAFKTIKSVQGIALVFDVTSRKTFDNVNLWLEEIKEHFDNPCLVLLGNKVDIEKEKWEVTKEEIEQFAKKKNMAYFETSAKTSKGINESFVHLANIAYDKIEKHKKEEPEEDNDDNKIEIKPENKKKKEKKKPC